MGPKVLFISFLIPWLVLYNLAVIKNLFCAKHQISLKQNELLSSTKGAQEPAGKCSVQPKWWGRLISAAKGENSSLGRKHITEASLGRKDESRRMCWVLAFILVMQKLWERRKEVGRWVWMPEF